MPELKETKKYTFTVEGETGCHQGRFYLTTE